MRTGQHLEAFSTTFGLVASIAVHIAALAYIASATAQYDFDFELMLPAEVEFGLTGEMAMGAEPPPRATGNPDPRWASPPSESPDPSDVPMFDAGVPEENPDAASNPDPAKDTVASPDTDTAPANAANTPLDTAPLPVARSALAGKSRIPPGAQLALRVDLKRVRESPLAPDVTSFLRGVPDWQLLLDGSGIDPVADLDRLLVATPNLQRSKLVVAGRHRREPGFARRSVSRLARSRGKKPRWQQRHGVPTAPWHDLDPTPRTIALLSDRHFSITRRQDLERVLAMAKARELRDAKKEGLVVARGPDALLSMGPEEAISLEVEGVHRFVVGNIQHLPTRLRLAVRETGANEATVTVLATFADAELADDASVYWKRVATFYSQQLIITLAGFGKTLRQMDFTPADERIRISFKLNADQIRFILSYAEGRLRGSGARAAPRSAPGRNQKTPTKKGP